VTASIALYALGVALATTDTSRLVARAGQIQPLMEDVAVAADVGARSGEPKAVNAAIAALDFHVAELFRRLDDEVGSEQLLADTDDVESAVAVFTLAARDYAACLAGPGDSGDSLGVATARIDVLVEGIVDWSESRLERSHGAIVTVIIVVFAGGALAAFGLWSAAREAVERGQTRSDAREKLEARRELEATSEDLPDIVFKTDADGMLIFVSEASSTLLGHVPSSMVGRSIYEFATRPAAIPMLPLADADGVRPDCDWNHVDGPTRRPELNARADEGGLGMRGVLRDISDRLAIEEALRESEERFTFMIETAHAGITVVTADGVRFGNPALAELLGRSQEELEGIDVPAPVPPEEGERFGSLIANRIWTGAEPVRSEKRLLRADGGLRDVEVTISPFSEQGEIVRRCWRSTTSPPRSWPRPRSSAWRSTTS
jgi:PAS domain S-box-containing protein